jgi:zinc/manganese transport system substrate-binding protein
MIRKKNDVSSLRIYTNSLKKQIMLVFTLFSLLFASSCNQVKDNSEEVTANYLVTNTDKIKIVTTFLPIYLFTKAVAGDVADVEILLPPGTDVHEYQATPDDVKAIATAKVLIKNGLGMEEFIGDTIKNAENSQLVEIDSSQGIKVIEDNDSVKEKIDTDHHHDHDHKHEHPNGNPHVWLDPILAKQQIINIRDGLIAADPKNKETYQNNAAVYLQKLDNLNSEFEQTLNKTPNCTFITFHDAFSHLAKRYQLKQVAVVEIPEDQLSPADVKKTINTVRKYQVKALFSEPGVDNKLLDNLSQELQLTLYPLKSLESGETNPEYYFQAMKDNLQNLATGCK